MPKDERMLIDGKWRPAQKGATFDVRNPADGRLVGRVACGSRADARRAIEAAHKAGRDWAETTPRERGKLLAAAAEIIRRRADALARLVTLENGKPLLQSMAEVNGSVENFTWYAEEARRAYGRIVPTARSDKRWLVIKRPVGVVASISPWNFPILLQARKVAPALAAGCTVVMRPASYTPLVAVELARCLVDAGIPKGVVNLVTGPAREIAEEFLQNPLCRKITFTGSTEVGRGLMRGVADQVKRLSLELGGHAPFIVFPDADIQQAAEMAADGKFRNTGQTCISPNRFYIHADVYDDFLRRFVAIAKKMKVGHGLTQGVEVGPMIDRAGFEKCMVHIEDAVAKGAKVLCGGKRLTGGAYDKGFFLAPTILAPAREDMLCMTEETFGPVAPIATFHKEDEAIEKANNTIYGLASYAFSRDIKTVMRAAERLEAGIIGINDALPAVPECPFGGVKQSGVGREGGSEGLDAFLETKFVSVVL
ncbi:MAG: NAD-dependent succinate-semialdehyde dehydrogenase [Planctomycetota bacterium]